MKKILCRNTEGYFLFHTYIKYHTERKIIYEFKTSSSNDAN